MEDKKYPNYEKLAAYLNTFDNPQRLLSAFIALCKPICDSPENNSEESQILIS